MSVKRETFRAQSNLANYCRTGKNLKIPGARPERIGVYRELIGGVFTSNLNHVYPITRGALGQEQWEELVDLFFAQHKALTPYYWKMPSELCHFVKVKRLGSKWNKPWLDDLLLFEWLEVEVYMMKDLPIPLYDRDGDLMNQAIVINPEYRLNLFHYPVFKVPAHELVDARGLDFLLTYRHPETFDSTFIELSALFAFVFEVLANQPMSGNEVLTLAQKEFTEVDQSQLQHQGEHFLYDLHERWALLGVLPKEL